VCDTALVIGANGTVQVCTRRTYAPVSAGRESSTVARTSSESGVPLTNARTAGANTPVGDVASSVLSLASRSSRLARSANGRPCIVMMTPVDPCTWSVYSLASVLSGCASRSLASTFGVTQAFAVSSELATTPADRTAGVQTLFLTTLGAVADEPQAAAMLDAIRTAA